MKNFRNDNVFLGKLRLLRILFIFLLCSSLMVIARLVTRNGRRKKQNKAKRTVALFGFEFTV